MRGGERRSAQPLPAISQADFPRHARRRRVRLQSWVLRCGVSALGGRLILVLSTALAPTLWGSAYVVFTQLLPTDHPLLISAMRALPAGLLLMALGAGLPPRRAILPLGAIGLANIGLFFGFLFVAAARLPAGLAATLGATQPLIVAFLAWAILRRPPTGMQVAAAAISVAGVALLVLARQRPSISWASARRSPQPCRWPSAPSSSPNGDASAHRCSSPPGNWPSAGCCWRRSPSPSKGYRRRPLPQPSPAWRT